MAPATRSGGARPGKDAEQKIQQTLDTDGNVKKPKKGRGSGDTTAGKSSTKPAQSRSSGAKRANDEQDDDEDEPEQKKAKTAQPAGNDPVLKQEAAEKQGLKDANEIDDQAEAAKAKGAEMMEQGIAKKPSRGTLESGHIYIWYKPKVETDDPQGLDDVAKCHILLLPSPKGGKDTKYRFITCGRKHLPAARETGNREQEWGMLSRVGSDLSELQDAFGSSSYETKTRGTRHQPASRCAAYGHYILHSPTSGEGIKPEERASDDHPRDHPVYLAYSISVPLPEDFGDVQKELEIQPTGSILISVKNPDAPSTNPAAPRKRDDQKDAYPPELRALFTTRWIPANPVELLDYPGQELLLISGKQTLPDHSEKEVIEPAEKTQEEVKDREKKEDDDKVIYDEVFGQLKAFREQKDTLEIRALEGQWA